MTDWRIYWNSAPAAVGEFEHLRQVGKTVNGRPVPESLLDSMTADVVRALRIDERDRMLDLCCGNGLLTFRCAKHCSCILGVDFSEPLIRIARTHFSAPNIEYLLSDALALPPSILREGFSKILLYEAIQHLTTEEAERLLGALRESPCAGAPVLLGSIPDRERIWNFYDTRERREEYDRRFRDGTEAIGHWWTPSEIIELGRRRGYEVEILSPDPELHVAHYRFDALLSPAGADSNSPRR